MVHIKATLSPASESCGDHGTFCTKLPGRRDKESRGLVRRLRHLGKGPCGKDGKNLGRRCCTSFRMRDVVMRTTKKVERGGQVNGELKPERETEKNFTEPLQLVKPQVARTAGLRPKGRGP